MLRGLASAGSVLFSMLLLVSCGDDEPPPRKPTAAPAAIPYASPHRIDINGIRFYQSRSEVVRRAGRLSCSENYLGDRVCYWRPDAYQKKHGFGGIDGIVFTFTRDTLHAMKITYDELLDVDYTFFDAKMRRMIGAPVTSAASDSSALMWQSDSLVINLSPNRKQHWTKTVYTYTPVAEFRERMLRKQ